MSDSMAATPITRKDVMGKRIRYVLQRDLPYDEEKEFQERDVVIELESGLRFSLERETEVLDPKTGCGLIYPYTETEGLYREIDPQVDPNLNSPIRTMIRPYGYEYFCGVVLENGFILIDGFAMTGNSILFMHPSPETMAKMEVFELPE